MFVEPPLQIVPPPAVTEGNAFILTPTELVAVQLLLSVTVTVKVIEALIIAVGEALLEGEAPADQA